MPELLIMWITASMPCKKFLVLFVKFVSIEVAVTILTNSENVTPKTSEITSDLLIAFFILKHNV